MKRKLKTVPCACVDRGAGRPCRDDVVITGDDCETEIVHDRPMLLPALLAEGYEVDASEYTSSKS